MTEYEDGAASPSFGTLRTTSTNLMGLLLGEQFNQHLEMAAQVQRYYLAAEEVGVARGVAAEILHQAQGRRAGSTPTAGDLEAARESVLAHALSSAVPMADGLRATVTRLAATTAYSAADITAAVEVLRGVRDPWPDDRIDSVLPAVAEMAARGPHRFVDAARAARAVSA